MARRTGMLIGGSIFGLLHLMAVVRPVVTSHGTGESQGWCVYLFDFPLVWLLDHFRFGRNILSAQPSVSAYVFTFSVVGTLMYVAVGILFGYVVARLCEKKPQDHAA